MKEIKRIIDAYAKIDHSTIDCALAVVIDVEGSAYRRIGARMLVMSDGRWIGGISGGCLEGDALRRAQFAIFKKEPSITTYDTRNDDENQIGVGLGCNGRIDVLFIPIFNEDSNNPINVLENLLNSRQDNILMTVCESNHEEYSIGYSELHGSEGQTINFKEINESLINDIRRKRKSRIVDAEGIKVLIEYLPPQTRLVVIGDNYDVNTIVQLASEMGWLITIVGNIKKLDKSIHQLAERVLSYSELNMIEMDVHTAVVLMSHDFRKDLIALRHFVQIHKGYIGLLGPRKRLDKMIEEMKDQNLDTSFQYRDSFFNPIGLNIGAESPEEIALSAISEIVSYFKNQSSDSLKYKSGPIHDRD